MTYRKETPPCQTTETVRRNGHHRARRSLPLSTTGEGLYGIRYLSQDSAVNFWRLDELGITDHPNLKLVEYDLTDMSSTIRLLEKAGLKRCITSQRRTLWACHLTANHHCRDHWDRCVEFAEAIRIVDSNIRFYQASTSEMFGKVRQFPRTRLRRLSPQPLWMRKLFAHWSTVNYRESYGILRLRASFLIMSHR